jgi:hypothetical protein
MSMEEMVGAGIVGYVVFKLLENLYKQQSGDTTQWIP